jgi:hypothetical protein
MAVDVVLLATGSFATMFGFVLLMAERFNDCHRLTAF